VLDFEHLPGVTGKRKGSDLVGPALP
jgi:hypothetical protein